jgi:hypothetical protein
MIERLAAAAEVLRVSPGAPSETTLKLRLSPLCKKTQGVSAGG